MRAYVKSDLNDYKGALADFDKAIEVEPLNELNYSSRGLLKEMNGDFFNFKTQLYGTVFHFYLKCIALFF